MKLVEFAIGDGFDAPAEPFDVLDFPLYWVPVLLDVLRLPVLFEVGPDCLIRDEIGLKCVDVHPVALETAPHPGPLRCRDIFICEKPINVSDFTVQCIDIGVPKACSEDLLVEVRCQRPETHPVLLGGPPSLHLRAQPLEVVLFLVSGRPCFVALTWSPMPCHS